MRSLKANALSKILSLGKDQFGNDIYVQNPQGPHDSVHRVK